jgi:uncharacterized integral membrane protein
MSDPQYRQRSGEPEEPVASEGELYRETGDIEYDTTEDQTQPVSHVQPYPVPSAPPEQAKQNEPHKSASEKAQETARNVYRIIRLVIMAALGAIVALFVIRNWEDVSFDYVFGDTTLPLALIMLLFTVIGIILGMLIYWFTFRHRD